MRICFPQLPCFVIGLLVASGSSHMLATTVLNRGSECYFLIWKKREFRSSDYIHFASWTVQEVGRSLATAAPFGELLGYSSFNESGLEYYVARYNHNSCSHTSDHGFQALITVVFHISPLGSCLGAQRLGSLVQQSNTEQWWCTRFVQSSLAADKLKFFIIKGSAFAIIPATGYPLHSTLYNDKV